MAKRRRAPGVEAIAVMAPMLRFDWCRYQIQFRGRGRDQSAASSCCSRSTATARARSARRSRTSCGGAIRDGALRPGARVPSTRDLARQLGVSRRVAVDAYAQLAAEGYLRAAPGRAPARVASAPRPTAPAERRRRAPAPRAALRLPPERARTSRRSRARPGCAALREALGDDDRRRPRLRRPARRRGAARRARRLPRPRARRRRRPARVVVTSGYIAGARPRLPRARRRRRARGSRSRTRATPSSALIAARAGLEPVRVAGRRATGCASTRSRAPAPTPWSLTPAHQHPTGVVLVAASGAPRCSPGCASATRSRSRTTTTPSTATTAPPSARCRGSSPTASSTPARRARRSRPALRLGWLVRAARRSLDARARARSCSPTAAPPRIDQHAFADFLARGELDRHLRRMRARYRARRDALVAALADELPEADRPRHRRRAARDRRAARRRRRGRRSAREARAPPRSRSRRWATTARRADGPPTLLLGYAQMPEPAIAPGCASSPPRCGESRAPGRRWSSGQEVEGVRELERARRRGRRRGRSTGRRRWRRSR